MFSNRKTDNDQHATWQLYKAAKRGDLEQVRYLLEDKKINPNTMIHNLMSMDNGPILKFAAESGNLELVRYLVETHQVDIEARGEFPGTQDTALSRAAREGHVKVMTYLIAHGAKADASITQNLGTMLYHGIFSGKTQVIDILVQSGAKILPSDLYYAVLHGQLDIVKYFIAHGANIHEQFIAPYPQVAAKSGNVAMLQYLEFEFGFNVLMPHELRSWENPEYEMIKAAAESGSVDMMCYLVGTHRLKLNDLVEAESAKNHAYKYDADMMILGLALASGSISLMKYLFETRKLIPSTEKLKYLADALAISMGLRLNAYMQSFLVQDEEHKSLLKDVVEQELEALSTRKLFRLYNADIFPVGVKDNIRQKIKKIIDSRELTNEQIKENLKDDPSFLLDALFYYSEFYFKNNFDKLKYIIGLGVDINAANAQGETVLMRAIYSGDYNAITNYLITAGADLDQPDREGKTAINCLTGFLLIEESDTMQALKHANDYTNSLRYASKEKVGRGLAAILKHSQGEIGQVPANELLENALQSGQLTVLLRHVSGAVCKEMESLLVSPSFMAAHDLTHEDVLKIFADAQSESLSSHERDTLVISMTMGLLKQFSCLFADQDEDNELSATAAVAPQLKFM